MTEDEVRADDDLCDSEFPDEVPVDEVIGGCQLQFLAEGENLDAIGACIAQAGDPAIHRKQVGHGVWPDDHGHGVRIEGDRGEREPTLARPVCSRADECLVADMHPIEDTDRGDGASL